MQEASGLRNRSRFRRSQSRPESTASAGVGVEVDRHNFTDLDSGPVPLVPKVVRVEFIGGGGTRIEPGSSGYRQLAMLSLLNISL